MPISTCSWCFVNRGTTWPSARPALPCRRSCMIAKNGGCVTYHGPANAVPWSSQRAGLCVMAVATPSRNTWSRLRRGRATRGAMSTISSTNLAARRSKRSTAAKDWATKPSKVYYRMAAQQHAARPVRHVQRLGIDEIALKKGHGQYALVVSDVDQGCVLTVLPERTKEALEAYLATWTTDQRAAITDVALDLDRKSVV